MVPFIPLVIYMFSVLSEKDKLTVTYLDVGQGDASVIELPDGRTMLMDTGNTGREPASFLKYRGRQCIDILVFSHGHPDHTGGFEYLTDRFNVREIWDNGRLTLPDGLSHIPHRSLNRGDVIEGPGYVYRSSILILNSIHQAAGNMTRQITILWFSGLKAAAGRFSRAM